MKEPLMSNDALILNATLKEFQKLNDAQLSTSEIFERFAIEQILKNYNIDRDEVESGIIDGGDDGGIDAIYLLINGRLCDESILDDENIKNFKTNHTCLTLYVIQTKEIATFKEGVTKFILSTMQDFFQLGVDMPQEIYNSGLIEKRELFKQVFLTLAPFHPIVDIEFAYCTKGDARKINAKISNTIRQITDEIRNTTSGIDTVNFNLYGATELISLSRILPQYKLALKFEEIMNLKDSYIILVKIRDYFNFLNDTGKIRDNLFEANIRDHQGNVAVNEAIRYTLESPEEIDTDFWWLNNGVTIIASEATIAASTINLDKIQIVNGLQTSYSIFGSYAKMIEVNKDKELMVRVILTSENDPRTDKIIKATNSQTPLSAGALRATDLIQRNIEDYLKSKNLFYDRRKNYYKNIGKNSAQIISIQYMAQVINAIVLKLPHISRSAPGSLVNNDNNYSKIFSYENIELYAQSVIYMKQVLSIIKGFNSDNYKRHENLDFQYHVGYNILQRICGKNYGIDDILALDLTKITTDVVENSLKDIIDNARKIASTNHSPILNVAKSKEFTDYISSNLIFKS